MKKRIISLCLVFCFLGIYCVPVFAINNNVGECGHPQNEHFVDSDECVQCFEERIIAEQAQSSMGGASPYGYYCPNCGRSSVQIVCAKSNIIQSENVSSGPSQACLGCKRNTCNANCQVLRYMSYAKYDCTQCTYTAYVFNDSGTGLIRHYCNLYDYCTGEVHFMCDLSADIPTYPDPDPDLGNDTNP